MKALEKIKELITKEPGPLLSYYDHSKELHLQVDTSKSGLGTVLLQDSKPVANASKSLTPTEENYGQIEKELYAVVFGCKRFHMYVYGRKVVVEFDHKPLEPILRKPLAATPPHLQRIILQLQRYDIQKYCTSRKPGKDIPIADALSSKSIPYKLQSLDEDMDAQIHTVVTNHPVSDRKLSDIRTATEQDPQLISLRSIVKSEWPDAKKKKMPFPPC
ncbi:Retrovirus-related Pol polyprotein [Labeo rohita]|uniref:Retrovirus-related Pol polyprotein n=1 Tax=Labeo rohita TaxID=84645 RepID=A0ABQ8MP58_LABRO|nr:Retrovirus-related Pol polyprotein [Labeo rohita]